MRRECMGPIAAYFPVQAFGWGSCWMFHWLFAGLGFSWQPFEIALSSYSGGVEGKPRMPSWSSWQTVLASALATKWFRFFFVPENNVQYLEWWICGIDKYCQDHTSPQSLREIPFHEFPLFTEPKILWKIRKWLRVSSVQKIRCPHFCVPFNGLLALMPQTFRDHHKEISDNTLFNTIRVGTRVRENLASLYDIIQVHEYFCI